MTTPKTDYASFARPAADGRIWWALEDALKLGAGYLPMRDDTQTLVPRLVAPSQRVKANERDLLEAFHKNQFNLTVPPTDHNDDGTGVPLVDAARFLNWLSQYIAHSQADIRIPAELVHAVRDGRREHLASDEDSSNQAAYSRAWDLWVELDEVRADIAEYKSLHPQTITEKTLKEDSLRMLRERERTLDAQLLLGSDESDVSSCAAVNSFPVEDEYQSAGSRPPLKYKGMKPAQIDEALLRESESFRGKKKDFHAIKAREFGVSIERIRQRLKRARSRRRKSALKVGIPSAAEQLSKLHKI